ncbi:MAG: polyphosphate polymerase domain-containing protein [Lachnospiraceae bacterium]|nr:polyphosphate polymerase domain-containing protein [Lachnospiraceae bacterium]
MSNLKYRHENKYLCSLAEVAVLEQTLQAIMEIDKNVGEDGIYHIRSIYFDDINNACFYQNYDGVSHRAKWRIRAYNNNKDRIMLECKHKDYGMIRKESCSLTMEQFSYLISDDYEVEICEDMPSLLKEFICIRNVRHMSPKVIVGYDRRPFVCKEGNVRVTIDYDIFSCNDISDFFEDDLSKRFILHERQQLLEVKFDEYIPDYIYQTIQQRDMKRVTFSKYYLCRQLHP